jgi:hypothetical protein
MRVSTIKLILPILLLLCHTHKAQAQLWITEDGELLKGNIKYVKEYTGDPFFGVKETFYTRNSVNEEQLTFCFLEKQRGTGRIFFHNDSVATRTDYNINNHLTREVKYKWDKRGRKIDEYTVFYPPDKNDPTTRGECILYFSDSFTEHRSYEYEDGDKLVRQTIQAPGRDAIIYYKYEAQGKTSEEAMYDKAYENDFGCFLYEGRKINFRTTYQYNSHGQQTASTRYFFDPADNMLTDKFCRNKIGERQVYSYDTNGHRTAAESYLVYKDASGEEWTEFNGKACCPNEVPLKQYDSHGNPILSISENGDILRREITYAD